MLRLSLAVLLIPAPAFSQVRLGVSAAAPEVRPVSLETPALSAPSIVSPALSLSAPALTASPVLAAPSIAPVAAAVPAKAAVTAPAALKPVLAAASTPEKPAAITPDSAFAERAKSEGASLFDGAMNVLVAGSEAVPFIKTGGLADVVDAVSRGLAARGHSVTLVLPKYKQLKTAGMELKDAGSIILPVGGRVETAKLLVGERAGVRVVLLEHPEFYERDGGPYAEKAAPGQPAVAYSAYDAAGLTDADERFGFYARAALEASRVLGFKPDVIHAHDWHAALIPTYLKSVYRDDPFFAGTQTALTIHNIAFQGAFALATAGKLGFDEAHLEHNGGANFLKSGIAHADAVTTVSPTYAREIIENAVFGMGLEDVLAKRENVEGILNALDPELWDPRTDDTLVRNYGVEDAAEGKAANKAAMQKRLGLEEKPDAPLFVVASRLTHQKGVDMIYETAAELVRRGGQLAIMGSGDAVTEGIRAALVARFPGKVASHPFDDVAVRMLFAAADFLLMPSRFEPCGLSQLIAQRYGALPIVTSTGGLADTVVDLREDPVNGTGLVVKAIAGISLGRAIADAIKGYHHPRALALARRASMLKDSSWEIPLDVYEALFRRLLGRRSEGPEKR